MHNNTSLIRILSIYLNHNLQLNLPVLDKMKYLLNAVVLAVMQIVRRHSVVARFTDMLNLLAGLFVHRHVRLQPACALQDS